MYIWAKSEEIPSRSSWDIYYTRIGQMWGCSGLWPPKPSHFSVIGRHLKKLPQGLPELLEERTTRKTYCGTSSLSCHWCGGIKIPQCNEIHLIGMKMTFVQHSTSAMKLNLMSYLRRNWGRFKHSLRKKSDNYMHKTCQHTNLWTMKTTFRLVRPTFTFT